MGRDIQTLHPHIRSIAPVHIQRCAEIGIKIILTQTLRSAADQAAIYAQGRFGNPGKIVTYCKYPQSPHCWGCAYDICVIINGQAVWGERDDLYRKAAAIGKELGLQWGGEFKKLYDSPHFEDPEFVKGKSVKWLVANYGTPQKFIATWGDVSYEPPVLKNDVLIMVDGVGITATGFLLEDLAMVPIRALGDFLKLAVVYDSLSRTTTVGGRVLPGTPAMRGGVGYYPVREVKEALGVSASWDGATKTIKLVKNR